MTEPALTDEEWRQQLQQLETGSDEDCIAGPDDLQFWLSRVEDWSNEAKARSEAGEDDVPFDITRPALYVENGNSAPCIEGDDSLFAVIALCNAALPDGDPRKFTWADYDLWNGRNPEAQVVADKIRAILPPRPPN